MATLPSPIPTTPASTPFDLTISAGQSSGQRTFSLDPHQRYPGRRGHREAHRPRHGRQPGLTIADTEITITDDDALPELTIANASVVEGGKAMFTVTLTPASGRDVTVQWTTGDDTAQNANQATANTDYTAQNAAATLTIAAASTTGTVEVQTTEDTLYEGDETFMVELASPTNATLGSPDTATGTITDNDTAPMTAALSVSPSSVGEAASTTTITVSATLDGSVTFDEDTAVRVTVGKGGDTAVSDTDYTGVSPFDLTISAGQSSGQRTFTLVPTNDTLDEDNEKLTVHATAGGLTTIADTEITITDDDAPPELTIANASVVEGGKAMFTVTLTPVSGRDVTVQWTTGDDGTDGAVQATADTDYTAQTTAATLTIAAGSTTGTVEVQTTEDTLYEGDETFAVELASPTNATLGSPDTGIGTITDNDTAPMTAALSVSPSSVGEAASTTTITVTATLDGSVTFDEDTTVRVTIGKDGDTAVSDTDYTGVSPFDLTISAGQSSGQRTFSLAPTNDTLDEDNEKLTVHATAGGLTTIADTEITITDDDAPPELTIANASVVEGGKAQFTVTLTPVSGRDVTVQWTTGDDGTDGAAQATADTDYTAQTTAATLTIAAGSTTGTVEVQTTEDTLDEGAETFAVELASPTNATLGSPDTGIGTITDNDALPELTIANASVSEGGKAMFTVTLTPVSGRDVTVQWTTGDDGTDGANQATADTDYTALTTAATLTIAAGSTTGTVEVQTTEDTLDENDETFVVNLASPTNATLGTPSTATGTITDDDAEPTVSLGDATAVTEGDDPATTVDMEFPLTLDTVSGLDVTVTYTLSGTATAGSDYTDPVTKTATIAAGSTTGNIVIPIKGDLVAEGNETVIVTLSGATNASVSSVSGEDTGTGTITDNDTTPMTASLSVSPTSVDEDASTTTITVTATLDGSVTFTATTTVRVTIGKDGDTAVSDTDYTGVSPFDLTISAGQRSGQRTFSLTPNDDALDEEDAEKLTVHATATGLTITDTEITITDDDAEPELTIADASVSEGGKAMFTVTLTPVSGRDVTVQWTTGDDGTDGAVQATADTDYTAQTAAATLTIAAGDTEGAIEVQTTEDTLYEGDETFAVELASPTNATLGTPSTATGTITDDDTAPMTAALSVSPTSVSEEDGATTVTVTATLDGNVTFTATTTVRVTVGKDGDTAVSDTDYTGVNAFDLTISAGQSSGEKTFSLTPINDTLSEGNETLTVHATATGLTITDAQVTINDDDTSPTTANLSVSPSSVGEEDGATTVTVTATLDGNVTFTATTTVRVTVGKDGDTAVSDTDYTGVNAFDLTISAGQSSGEKTFSLTPTNDTLSEGNETLTVHATATGLTIADTEITITDDDALPELTIAGASVVEGYVGTAMFTVTLTPVSGRDVTVQWTTGDDADGANQATANTDYTAQTTAQTVTIAAGSSTSTVSVQTTEDTLDEADETFVVNLASPTNATLGTPSTATGTINDDDAEPTISLGDATAVTEGDDPATTVDMEFPLTLNPVSGRDVTVTYTLSGTATAGSDYTAPATKTATIAAGSTTGNIVIPIKGDLVAEGNETVIVTLSGATNASVSSVSGEDTGTGTITDNDTTPTTASLSVSPNSVGEGDGATTVTVTATLDGNVTFTATTTVRVTVGKDGDTAVSDTDYTGVNAFDLTISAGQRSGEKTFSLTPTNDTLSEGNETLTVHATATGLTIADARGNHQ